jgi:hypothetical protein
MAGPKIRVILVAARSIRTKLLAQCFCTAISVGKIHSLTLMTKISYSMISPINKTTTMFAIVHHDVEAPPAPMPFSPLELCPLSSQNAALQKALSKSMAHLCVLNLLSSFSMFTGETAATSKSVVDDDLVSCSCRSL